MRLLPSVEEQRGSGVDGKGDGKSDRKKSDGGGSLTALSVTCVSAEDVSGALLFCFFFQGVAVSAAETASLSARIVSAFVRLKAALTAICLLFLLAQIWKAWRLRCAR